MVFAARQSTVQSMDSDAPDGEELLDLIWQIDKVMGRLVEAIGAFSRHYDGKNFV